MPETHINQKLAALQLLTEFVQDDMTVQTEYEWMDILKQNFIHEIYTNMFFNPIIHVMPVIFMWYL
jgi:hypothetical protein